MKLGRSAHLHRYTQLLRTVLELASNCPVESTFVISVNAYSIHSLITALRTVFNCYSSGEHQLGWISKENLAIFWQAHRIRTIFKDGREVISIYSTNCLSANFYYFEFNPVDGTGSPEKMDVKTHTEQKLRIINAREYTPEIFLAIVCLAHYELLETTPVSLSNVRTNELPDYSKYSNCVILEEGSDEDGWRIQIF